MEGLRLGTWVSNIDSEVHSHRHQFWPQRRESSESPPGWQGSEKGLVLPRPGHSHLSGTGHLGLGSVDEGHHPLSLG